MKGRDQPASAIDLPADLIPGSERGVPSGLALTFLALLGFIALLPATRTPWVRIADVPVSTKDLALVGEAVIGLLYCAGRPKLVLPFGFAKLVLALFAYASISTAWNGLSGRDATAMAYVAMVSASASAIGYSAAKTTDTAGVERILAVLTLGLTAIATLYSAQSFFHLGLRSTIGASLSDDFGVQRVHGPMFGSSAGGFLLLPALAFALEEAVRGVRSRALWSIASLLLFVSLFGLGSRSALLALGAFTILTLVLVRSTRLRLALAIAVAVLGALAGAFVFSRATSERLVSFRDESREATYEFADRVLHDRDSLRQVIGSGLGGTWPWYLADVEEDLYGEYNVMQETRFGETLYHPHSTLLLVVVELGAIGMLVFLLLLLACAGIVLRARRCRRRAVLPIGLLASVMLMAFDLFLFKNASVNACWWVYAFGAIRLGSAPGTREIPRPCGAAA